MSERVCVRGCTVRGEHYAACSSFGQTGGECQGCVPTEARDGVLLCDRCYGKLLRRIEVAPDLVAHLRSIADPLKAAVYDRVMVQGSGSDSAPAPVAADLIDASADIMHAIQAQPLEPGESSDGAYRKALTAVHYLTDHFDTLANDGNAILETWRVVMSAELPEAPEFWTITRALSRWPLEDRPVWAKQPCPECGMRTVKITPPRHRFARTWFACSSCGWRKTDKDDDGLWAAAFGLYAEAGRDEGNDNMGKLGIRDIDITVAVREGVQHVIERAEQVEQIGTFGVPAAAVEGAVPALAEQFALVADQVAAEVRGQYANGDLIAGGARLVAAAIRAAGKDGDTSILDHLAQELGALEQAPEAAA